MHTLEPKRTLSGQPRRIRPGVVITVFTGGMQFDSIHFLARYFRAGPEQAAGRFRSSKVNAQPRRARQAVRNADECYSLILLFRSASISRFSSSGVSFGRSIVSVSLLSLPVNLNGT